MDMKRSDDDNEHAVLSWRGWGQHPQKFGLEMQNPWSNHLLNGCKQIETRGYDLPPTLLSKDNEEVKIDILESQQGKDGVSVVPNVVHLTSQSPLKRIGWATFVQSFRYTTRQQFEIDADKHLVDPSSAYGWSDDRPMYGWVVGRCGTYIADESTNNIIAKRRMRSLFQIGKKPTVLITGASGMLGRAVYRLLCQEDSLKVIGTGYTRLKVDDYNLHQLDLLDHDTTTEFINKQKPDIIVHCAAERYPDAFESKLVESVKLNVESTRHLAQELSEQSVSFLFEIGKKPTVLITGASGMLGRAVYRLLCQEDSLKVIGTGYTRLKVDDYNLHQLDLLDHDTTTEFINKQKPDIIVHCAAERYPDAFESKLVESVKLNVESTRHLAQECKRLAGDNNDNLGPYLIYISTSYVFDGGIVSKELPPYKPGSKTNPINNYGHSKWDGECVVREILNNQSIIPGNGIIVRVPLLYGEDCNDLSESPALEMMKCFLPSNDKTTSKKVIDHWALRFPTSCEDVANVLKLMIQRILDNKFPVTDSSFGNTYHVAYPHGTTKYELMKMQAKLLNISSSLVEERTEGNSDGPPIDSAPRPQCTQLDCSETWKALGEQIEFTTLEDGMSKALKGFPDRFIKE